MATGKTVALTIQTFVSKVVFLLFNMQSTFEDNLKFNFTGSKITADGGCSHGIKTFAPWKKSYDKPRPCIKKQRHHFADKGLYSQSYGFFSSQV